MEAAHSIQFQAKRRSWRWKLGFTLSLLVGFVGLHRGYMEVAAWDSIEDIFFDLADNPDVGFRLLHDRWISFQPWIFPNTSVMYEAHQMAGCCLLLRFWGRLTPKERSEILEDARKPWGVSDYTREKQRLIFDKNQIETKGYASLSESERYFWILHSRTFGNRNTPPNIVDLEDQAKGTNR